MGLYGAVLQWTPETHVFNDWPELIGLVGNLIYAGRRLTEAAAL